jgi:hypothetical protein
MSTSKPATWHDIFELWKDDAGAAPAIGVMAADLGREYGTVRKWWERGPSVPMESWPDLIPAVEKRAGITLTYHDLVVIALAGPRILVPKPENQDAA